MKATKIHLTPTFKVILELNSIELEIIINWIERLKRYSCESEFYPKQIEELAKEFYKIWKV